MLKKLAIIIGLSFFLNFIWEISQAGLYSPHFAGLSGLILVHLRASLGDVLMVLLIFLLDVAVLPRIFRGRGIAGNLRFLAMALLGGLMAMLLEKHALSVGRWSYGGMMPIIPFINVGLTPVLQMVLLPPAILLLAEKLCENNR